MKRITLKHIRRCIGTAVALASLLILYGWIWMDEVGLLTGGACVTRSLITLLVGGVSVLCAQDW